MERVSIEVIQQVITILKLFSSVPWDVLNDSDKFEGHSKGTPG